MVVRKRFTRFVFVGVLLSAAAASYAQEANAPAAGSAPLALYVAPKGNDAWSGKVADPSADGMDGPLATLEAARDAIRKLKEAKGADGPIKVFLRGGVYRIAQPFVLQAQDSGKLSAPISYEAYPGEQPVISGGRPITGWRQEGQFWTVKIPEILSSDWRFSSLWVNGQRRGMSRTPNEGFFHTAGRAPVMENPTTGEMILRSTTGFRYEPGDIKRWENLDDALVVVLHSWETSFHHIVSIDEQNYIVTFRNPAEWPFENWEPLQRYYILNTFEGLDAPGEWYLNRQTGVLYYYPVPGEDMTTAEVVAPVQKQLLSLDGSPSSNQYIEHVRFSGLRFYHANFSVGPEGYGDTGCAVGVPGAIQVRGTRFCTLENCEIAHMDTYGVWLRAGCAANRVLHNELYDLGAGAVRIGEQQRTNDLLDVYHNVVDNNFIHGGGRVFRSGVGIWVGQSPLNKITHNEISDLSNTGIYVGWAWDKQNDFSYSTTIEYNHVHHVGKGEFTNMAGIALDGGSRYSTVRNNVVHDVVSYVYGGWGLCIGTGNVSLAIENNIIYNTTTGSFMQSYGNLNRVRNNIFAFSKESQVNLDEALDNRPLVFENNIVLSDNGLPFGLNWDLKNIWHDDNCYWDISGWDMDFGGQSFGEWQVKGRDVHSLVADPLFENLSAFDFRLKPNSPVLALGFHPIDASQAGLYGAPEWVAAPGKSPPPAVALPEAFKPKPVAEDFEGVATNRTPPGAVLYGIEGKASVRVTDETAASGQKSLKVVDSAGPQKAWQPEMCYTPHFRDGIAVSSFDVRLEPGAVFLHDWRSDWTGRRVGPRIRVNDKGEVTLGNDETPVMTVPLSQWFHVEVECALGKQLAVPSTYTLAITVSGQETKRFEARPCLYNRFRSLERCWFLSPAEKDAVFYLDNIRIGLK